MLHVFKTVLFIAALFLAASSLSAQEDTSRLPKLPAVEVVRAKIGTGPDDFAIGGASGPMNFVVSKAGELYILDQENVRIQVFKNNKRIKTIPIQIPRSCACDIDLLPDNNIVLMDNALKKMVFIIDQNGAKLKEFKLAGGGLPDPSTAAGVFAVKQDEILDGIWMDNGPTSVRLAFLNGNADPDRVEVFGRFTHTFDRQFKMDRAGDFTATVTVSNIGMTAGVYQENNITFDTYLQFILGLDEDASGNIHLLTLHWEGERDKVKDERNIVTVLGPGLNIEKMFLIFYPRRVLSALRCFRVSPDGKVYFMVVDDTGLCIRMYDPWKN